MYFNFMFCRAYIAVIIFTRETQDDFSTVCRVFKNNACSK